MGLVEYGSDSEDEAPSTSASVPQQPYQTTPPQSQNLSPGPITTTIDGASSRHSPGSFQASPEHEQPSTDDAPIVGPQRPPSDEDEDEEDQGPPLSPYTASRNLIHTLTLPPSIPTIPPSPPGSPPAPLAAKFAHFRDLKTKGVHFNEKLLRSSSLRNPNLLEKLTEFVGFAGKDQYATNLSSDLWDPTKFPKDAFVEALAYNQAMIGEAREKVQLESGRDKVEFVGSVHAPQVQAQPRERIAESAAERVMKGLDRERGGAPPARGGRRDRDREEGAGERRDDRNRRMDEGGDRGRGGNDHRDRRRDDNRRRRSRSKSRDRARVDRRHKDVEYRDRR
ncbi:HCNGP-like protein-domain-containing protein [Tricharina praecox]|uniref:HCNGP-like protein-domain-containing protein n=1 Tax=Tricharina praecox TaxID=43433 RepID=UPI0022205392|nr:HCNGP-like protein-domain-containing protein [Tricharina praecox]KAI5849998.1 HCNGP-like protein-domain-containing protein [Tricharina praecox]